jgi:hypothetical protein
VAGPPVLPFLIYLFVLEGAMTYLFTKPGCGACDWVKSNVNLSEIKDLEIYNLDGENSEALAMLAYYELVTLSEKNLPILLDDECDPKKIVTGPDYIKKYLEEK